MRADSARADPLPSGEVIDGVYRIEGVIGRGGMGTVYAAFCQTLQVRVAIKVLSRGLDEPVAIERFFNEVRATAQLHSPSIVRVGDIGFLPDGAPFYVMELLQGENLADRIAKKRPFALAEAVDYVLQAADAVAEVHDHGIVHRDLKPANLYLSFRPDGAARIKVLDFGIAKMLRVRSDHESLHSLTSTNAMLGTPSYMSPEQVRNAKTVDARADVWALGVILYELLALERPFPGETLGQIYASILEQKPPLVCARRPDVPKGLEAVIARCLDRKPAGRFASARDLATALRPFRSGDVPSATGRLEETPMETPFVPRLSASAATTVSALRSTPGPSRAGRMVRRSMIGAAVASLVIGGLLAWPLRPTPAIRAGRAWPPTPSAATLPMEPPTVETPTRTMEESVDIVVREIALSIDAGVASPQPTVKSARTVPAAARRPISPAARPSGAVAPSSEVGRTGL